jgi:hypothetical protein
VLAIVREDAVCLKLMTVPGVGPLVAVDDPSHRVAAKWGPENTQSSWMPLQAFSPHRNFVNDAERISPAAVRSRSIASARVA